MTTLQTVDGRVLTARRPQGEFMAAPGGFPSVLPPMWSNGEREGSGYYLKSFENIYRSQPIIGGVCNKLARRVGSLPVQVLQRDADGSRDVVTGNSLDTLLHKPMNRWGSSHLFSFIELSLLVHGNAVVAKVRSTNDRDLPPDMLWPLSWSKLTAYAETGGTIEAWGTTQFGYAASEHIIDVKDTVHFSWTDSEGSEIGVSPLEQLGTTIAFEDAAQRSQASLFRKGMKPSAAVTVDDPNPTSAKLQMAADIVKAAHAGMDQQGGWVWLGAQTKVTPLTYSPVEAALIEQRKLSREEVGVVYDLAGPLMNDLTHGTYSNVEELTKGLYRDVIPPWTTLIVETLQSQLIDPEPAWLDLEARFDFSDKLRGDPTEQAAVDKSDVEAGIRTRDEAREGRGLEPEGGQAAELTMNANNQAGVNSAPATSDSVPPTVNGR